MFKRLYLRIRYWRQLRQGFALLPSNGKRNFVKANDRLFIMNGVDPLVRVDLSTNKAEPYTAAAQLSDALDDPDIQTIHLTFHKPKKPAAEVQCPACGYYCLGNGGFGCIDKPKLVEMEGSDV
jgi:hypothetical protein